jgi:hypothetical protein
MAKLPIYQQQTTVQIPRADASMAGGQLAQAVAETGSALEDIRVNMQNRDDSIKKTITARDHDRAMQELSISMNTEDLADVNTFQKWKENALSTTEELIANYQGSNRSRAALREQLTNQLYQYEKSMRGAQIKAQHQMIGGMIEETTNKLSIDAGFAPETIGLTFESLDAQIDGFAADGAIPVEMAQQYKNSGRSAIAASAIQQLESRGEIGKAKELMNDPAIGRHLNRDTARQLTIRISAAEGRQAAERQRVENNVSRMRTLLGGTLTPEQEQNIRSMPPKDQRTPLDDIADWSMFNPGKPVPQAIIDKAYGFATSGTGSDWGNSIDGRAYTTLEKLASRYSMGMTTPEEDRQWQIATDILNKPKQTTDVMGKPVTIPGSLPGFVTQANQMRQGAPAPAAGGPAMPPAGAPAMPAAGGQIDNSFIDSQGRLDFNAIPPDAQPVAAPGGRTYESAQAAGGAGLTASMSAMELAPFITGPAAKLIAQPAGAMPGRPFNVDPRYREAQTRMNVIHDRASNALRPEGKIADQYRQELNKITALKGQAWDNEENYYQHVTGLDQNWRKMVKELDKIASGEVVSSSTGAREAADLANDLRFIIREFNVPQVRVYTREQLEKLPPGTPVFIGNSFKPNYRK